MIDDKIVLFNLLINYV